jgi:hypothetical protein
LFLVWPPRVWFQPPPSVGLRLLRLSAFLLIATSLVIGIRASVLDLQTAFRASWKETVPPPVAAQIAIVERETGREALLLTYADPNPWYPRMWQRIFYPRTVVLLSDRQADAATIARLRERYGIRYAVSMGPPPGGLAFTEVRDLGPLLGSNDRVAFGPLDR